MERAKQLKEQLLGIKKNDWKVPKEIDVHQLALELMNNIGSIDGELRDKLILPLLYRMIKQKILSKEQIREVLDISLSDKHLFYKLGEEQDDSVFNRAFTILIIRWIMYYHNHYGEDLLKEEEVYKVFEDVIRYVALENDIRGYVAGKGWAHAIAHSADALATLSQCRVAKKDELLKILEVVKEKSGVSSYIYAHQEHERLVAVVTSVMKRKILSEDEIISWIKSFGNLKAPENNPYTIYFKENVKSLLRSLYFRLKFLNESSAYFDEIEQVLNKVDGIYNSLENKDYF